MLHGIVPAAFEDVQCAGDVAADVGVGLLERVAHARLRGQVYDAREFLAGEELRHRAVIGEIELHEAEAR